MIESICDYSKCTGCKACQQICPKGCISMEKDALDSLKPAIGSGCIECKKCVGVCPNNNSILFRKIIKCFAAWSSDNSIRLSSASGGVATAIYRYCIQNDIFTAGCRIDGDGRCYYIPIETGDDIIACQNSKYVFSDTNDIYIRYKKELNAGRKAIFIGLPCQVAGLLTYLGRDYDNLTTVDIICHGVAPTEYLRQHIVEVSGNASKIFFRDPAYRTSKYHFTLYSQYNTIQYNKSVYDNDTYQVGYHKSLIYRENCYSCNYARPERISDITISDFSGFGRLKPANMGSENINCVLISSSKGEDLLNLLFGTIDFIERPVEEAIKFENQLNFPSVPHIRRQAFTSNYESYHNFERAVRYAISQQLNNYHIKRILHVNEIQSWLYIFMARLIPRQIRHLIKRHIGK